VDVIVISSNIYRIHVIYVTDNEVQSILKAEKWFNKSFTYLDFCGPWLSLQMPFPMCVSHTC